MPPKVSVIIPAYNVSDYIRAALVSLKRQTLSEFEALIVDDGSTDSTAEVARQFTDRDPRFKLLQKRNGGLSSARNYGIRHAQTPYIALLDADDVYHPDKLATHVARLEGNPQVGVVYSASGAIRDDGRKLWINISGKPVKADPLAALLCKNFVAHGSNAVFRRQICDEVGNFDESLRSLEDLDLWLRIAATRHWQFYREARTLCYYRVRPSGLSFDVGKMQHYYEQVIAGVRSRAPQVVEPMLPTAYAYIYRYLARLCLQAGDTVEARQYINQAWECDRTIFAQDPRSLITLASVHLAPLAKVLIKRSLASPKSPQK